MSEQGQNCEGTRNDMRRGLRKKGEHKDVHRRAQAVDLRVQVLQKGNRQVAVTNFLAAVGRRVWRLE